MQVVLPGEHTRLYIRAYCTQNRKDLLSVQKEVATASQHRDLAPCRSQLALASRLMAGEFSILAKS